MDGITTDFATLEKWYSDNKVVVERKVLDLCRRDLEILMLLSVY